MISLISPLRALLAAVIDGRVLEFACRTSAVKFSAREGCEVVSWQNVLMWSREKAALRSPNCDNQLKLFPFYEFLIRLISRVTSRVARQHQQGLYANYCLHNLKSAEFTILCIGRHVSDQTSFSVAPKCLCFQSRALMANLGTASRGGHLPRCFILS